MLQASSKIEVSLRSILKLVFVVLILWFLFLIRDVLLLFFITLIIVAALSPLVRSLEKLKIPRVVSVLGFFLILLGLLIWFFYLLIPPLIKELGHLAFNLPDLIRILPFSISVDSATELIKQFQLQLAEFSPKLIDTTKDVIGGLVSGLAVVVMSIYLLASKNGMRGFIRVLAPHRHRPYALDLWKRIEIKLGRWLLGQIVASLFVGTLTFVGLSFLGLPYAILLSIAVGLLEFVPYGPFFAFIPMVVLGFLQSSLIGFAVIILYVVVQQLEGQVVTPQIMSKAVGLNPVLIILAFLIGANVAGILGAVLAIPMAAATSVFINDLIQDRDARII